MRKHIVSIIVLLGITFVLFSPYLLSYPTPLIYPKSSLGTDLPREIWPLTQYIKTSIAISGELPLWRQYSLNGTAIAGHPIAPIFYPPFWIVSLLPTTLAINVVIALHILWAAIGMYLLITIRFQLSWRASLIGAILFSFTPKWLAHISGGHIPMIAAISWWPWIYLGFSQYWKTAKKHWLLLLGIGLAAQAMTHGSYLIMTVFWLFFDSFRSFQVVNWRLWLRKSFTWGIASAFLAISLSAVQIFPFLLLFPNLNRGDIAASATSIGALPLPLLLNILFPPDLKYPEWFIYPGVGVVALTIFGWALGWGRKEKWWASSVIFVALLSLGEITPLHRFLFRYFPGYSLLRIPSRWWIFGLFSFSILASYAVEKWTTAKTAKPFRVNSALIVLSTVYLSFLGISLTSPGLLPFTIIPSSLLLFACLFIIFLKINMQMRFTGILLVIIIDLFLVANSLIHPVSETVLSESEALDLIQAEDKTPGSLVFAPYGGINDSQILNYDLRAAGGYDSVQLTHYAKFVEIATGCSYGGFAVSIPATQSSPSAVEQCPNFQPEEKLLQFLGIHSILLPSDVNYTDHLPTSSSANFDLYPVENPLSTYFIVFGANAVSDSESCFASLLDADLSKTALTEIEFAALKEINPYKISEKQSLPNRAEVDVQLDSKGLLVRSVTWDAGWTVNVNGKPADLLKVNCAFQGVLLEGGLNEVEFEYNPKGYQLGKKVSFVSTIFLFAYLIFSLTKYKSRVR